MSDLASSSIDVNPHDLQEVLQVLNLYLPAVEVRAFGSRVKWTAKPYSDLDLALMTDHPLSLTQEAQLREAFDETTIPFKVDFVDWASTSKTFRKIIDSTSVVIRHASHTNAEHWAVMTLDEALEALLDYRGKTPEKTNAGIPLITAKIVKNGRIESPTEFIASSNYSAWMTRGLPKTGDVVLTTEAPLGEVAQLNSAQVALAQRIVVLRGKPGVLDNTYLRYLLQTHEMQEQLGARATGTTVVGIKQSELRKIAMRLPPIAQQLAVAKTLSGLDDKIELTRRTNETLEAMARAIFQSWFVDFDPVRAKASGESVDSICQRLGLTPELLALFPDSFEDSELGEIPTGWSVVPLAVLSKKISKGTTPSKQDLSTAKDEPRVPFLKVRDVTDQGEIARHNLELIPASIHESVLKRSILEAGDILFSIAGTIGRVAIVDPDLTNSNANQALAFVRLNDKAKYLGLCIQHLKSERILEAASASIVQAVQANVSLAALGGFKIIVPSAAILDFWNSAFHGLFSMAKCCASEARVLETIRDTLLPKLLSGELQVPAIEV